MAFQEIRNKYASTSFGLVWAYVHPLLLLAAMWIFVGRGLKNVPSGSVNLLGWIAPGLISWNYISESLNSAPSSIADYPFFLKLRNIPIESAIIIRCISIAVVHSFFIFILFGIEGLLGAAVSLKWLHVFYYAFCAFCFCISVSFITASIYPFFKDISFLTAILCQFGFWLSPVLWDSNALPPTIKVFFYLNPAGYIINGFRSCFFADLNFDSTMSGLFFWTLTITIFFIGQFFSSKLKPHFADVLNG